MPLSTGRQHGHTCDTNGLLSPFCPLGAAKVLVLQATVPLLLTLLI